MSEILIKPGVLSGEIVVPLSKSIAHRAVLCAALAGDLKLAGVGRRDLSDDITATCRAANILLQGGHTIDCGESGSTLRFLIPIAAAMGREITFTGAPGLAGRPIDEYLRVFEGKGVELHMPASGSLPLSIRGKLRSGTFQVSGDVSSQYVTGLLLALPLLEGNSNIVLTTKLESSSYVDLTIRVMQHFGIKVEKHIDGYFVFGRQQYLKTPYCVEGDYSQAAFWLTANFFGSRIRLTGLETSSAQGDKIITDILNEFLKVTPAGNQEEKEEEGFNVFNDVWGRSCENPVFEIDASQIPDIIPIICVAAANIKSTTKIVNAKRLRYKESDRITSVCDMIRNIGGTIVDMKEGMIITGTGQKLKGGTVDSYNDHRIAMAAAIAALNTREGVRLKNHQCVKKSYPHFFRDFTLTGGMLE
jgi:3-phosphoshikimate 1-carboxyvinyltransferase